MLLTSHLINTFGPCLSSHAPTVIYSSSSTGFPSHHHSSSSSSSQCYIAFYCCCWLGFTWCPVFRPVCWVYAARCLFWIKIVILVEHYIYLMESHNVSVFTVNLSRDNHASSHVSAAKYWTRKGNYHMGSLGVAISLCFREPLQEYCNNQKTGATHYMILWLPSKAAVVTDSSLCAAGPRGTGDILFRPS